MILGADLQPKYDLVQTTEMPEYDYDYHPNARAGFKKIFDVVSIMSFASQFQAHYFGNNI